MLQNRGRQFFTLIKIFKNIELSLLIHLWHCDDKSNNSNNNKRYGKRNPVTVQVTLHITSPQCVNVYITSPGPKSNVIPSPVVNYAYVKFENGRAKTLLCIARPLGIPLTEVIKMNLTFDQNLKGFSIRDKRIYEMLKKLERNDHSASGLTTRQKDTTRGLIIHSKRNYVLCCTALKYHRRWTKVNLDL